MAISTAFKLSRLGMVAAAALAMTAMPLYPGGTPLNRGTRGYSLFHNSLTDLGRTVAWNGEANPGSLLPQGCFLTLESLEAERLVAAKFGRAGGGLTRICSRRRPVQTWAAAETQTSGGWELPRSLTGE